MFDCSSPVYCVASVLLQCGTLHAHALSLLNAISLRLLCHDAKLAEMIAVSSQDAIVQIRWLPSACHVSAITEQGLEGLKSAVLALTTSPAWMSQIDEVLKSSQGPGSSSDGS
jgi:hypothetical protein